jgi:hypothetical protein
VVDVLGDTDHVELAVAALADELVLVAPEDATVNVGDVLVDRPTDRRAEWPAACQVPSRPTLRLVGGRGLYKMRA